MPSLKKTPTRVKDAPAEGRLKLEIDRMAKRLGKLQEKLYAGKKHAVLIVLQGLDGAGKDNAVKHVLAEVNPAGANVKGFKVPTDEERAHDFLWRIHCHCPERGMIQVFNRSHYEDVLVPVVNGELKGRELKARYAAINAFEQLLVDSGVLIFKFFLHASAEHQQERFQVRLEDPTKHWKHNGGDALVFDKREDYLRQYEQVFDHCQQAAPWHIIPADDKPYKNHRILQILLKGLDKAHLRFPTLKEAEASE